MNGFHQMDNKLMLEIITTCGGQAFAVYSVLFAHRNSQTGACYPSHATLGEEMGGMSVSTLKRELNKLKNAGFINWTIGGFDTKTGVNKANSYIFLKL